MQQAETSEDMHEWKTALESALSQAPSAALSMRQNGFFQSDAADVLEGSFGQCMILLSFYLLHKPISQWTYGVIYELFG